MGVCIRKLRVIVCGVVVSLVTAGCDSGSSLPPQLEMDLTLEQTDEIMINDSVGDTESVLTQDSLTGVFIDSAVQGLGYQTDSFSGITNEAGEFNYADGEMVEFFVGNIPIGQSVGRDIITPDNLIAKNGQYTLNHRRNLIRLLQTLDLDRDPTNGIEIRNDIANFTHNIRLDFDVPTKQFEQREDLRRLLAAVTNGGALVSELTATLHYIDSLEANGLTLVSAQSPEIEFVGNLDSGELSPYRISNLFASSGSAINKPLLDTRDNGYAAHTYSIIDPQGFVEQVFVSEGSSADEIQRALNQIKGVYTRASNSVDIDFGRVTDINTLQLSLNGFFFRTSSSIDGIAYRINEETDGILLGISATVSGPVLTITANLGVDLWFNLYFGRSNSDTITFIGKGGEQTLSSSANAQLLTVGGEFTIELSENYSLLVSSDDSDVNFIENELFLHPIVPKIKVHSLFDPSIPNTYNHSTSLELVDSLGYYHSLTLYFVRQTASNTWLMYVQVDGAEVGDPDRSLPWPENELPTRANFRLVFDGDGGLNSELSDKVYISNWQPKTTQGFDNGALGPLNVADGAVFPNRGPLENSNFEINVNRLQQLSYPFRMDLDSISALKWQQTRTVIVSANLDSEEMVLERRTKEFTSTGTDIHAVILSGDDEPLGNGYTAQTLIITDTNGVVSENAFPKNARAIDVASALDEIAGVKASSFNQVEIDFGYLYDHNTWQLSLNDYVFPMGASMQDIAIEVNNQTNSRLPGVWSSITGQTMTISANTGLDLRFSISGGISGTDSLEFRSTNRSERGTLVLKANGGTQSVTVGGQFTLVTEEDYELSIAPTQPSTESVANTLLVEPIVSPISIAGAFNAFSQATFNHATSLIIYDSLFTPHVLSMYFVKAKISNVWDLYVQVDDENVGDPDPTLLWPASTVASVARFRIITNTNGKINEDLSEDIFITNWVPLNHVGKYNGALLPLNKYDGATLPLDSVANSSNFTIDLTGLTFYADDFFVRSKLLEGYVRSE